MSNDSSYSDPPAFRTRSATKKLTEVQESLSSAPSDNSETDCYYSEDGQIFQERVSTPQEVTFHTPGQFENYLENWEFSDQSSIGSAPDFQDLNHPNNVSLVKV